MRAFFVYVFALYVPSAVSVAALLLMLIVWVATKKGRPLLARRCLKLAIAVDTVLCATFIIAFALSHAPYDLITGLVWAAAALLQYRILKTL